MTADPAVPAAVRALAEPLPRPQWSAALADAVDGLPDVVRDPADPDRPPALFAALARAGPAFDAWWGFARSLLTGRLDARDRELVILRTSWREGCGYEWGRHALIAAEIGLSAATVDAVRRPTGEGDWSPRHRALLDFVDAVCAGARPAPAGWAGMLDAFTAEEVVEILLLIGNYRLLAAVVHTLDLPDEPAR